jgi:hypothetical protein
MNHRLSTSRQRLLPWLSAAGLFVLTIIILRLQGRIWWCKFGDWALYIPQAWHSDHTSQHLLDPYSFTHVLHGLFFWLAFMLLLRKLAPGWRFFIAIFIECAWEILENTNYVIDIYRHNTASVDYFGDSILNSTGDILCCALGFHLAGRIGWKWTIALFFLVEAVLLATIRDSLLLNVIMLICPFDAIKHWQMGA